MTILVVATGNPGKVRELQAVLADLDWELQAKPAELEVDETGDTFAANACLKASEVARSTGEWAIADDSGLEVTALNGAPGVYSARYGNTDAERIQRLLTELGEQSDRSARFVCVTAVARPDGTIAVQTEGICPGEILHTPQGTGGFGYDPIFYVPEHQQTFAEMSLELKQSISHRGKALQALLPQLAALAV
ncbi:RdgB/HAM1 family non-canonical purine NTP pyrophosphatase [Pantanalinema rosaneae CENA516]|uniref:RdgB/HAM1 family non-canonical purine NTP pyrophosphatase n=1 Tax=Pantanalinema rosaneae TaxID=1620701 RepID=UPI003D6E715B